MQQGTFFHREKDRQSLESATDGINLLLEDSEGTQESHEQSKDILQLGSLSSSRLREVDDELATRISRAGVKRSQGVHTDYDDGDEKSSSNETQSIDALWNSNEPVHKGGLKGSGLTKRHLRWPSGKMEYSSESSMSMTMNDGIKKLRVTYQHVRPLTKDLSDNVRTGSQKALRWKQLVRGHIFTILLLLYATMLGAYYSTIKWTRLSSRLVDIHLSDIAEGRNALLGVDYEFAYRVLFERSRVISTTTHNPIGIAANHFASQDKHKASKGPKVNIFIPASERRIYSERRKLEKIDLNPEFSCALVCSELELVTTQTQKRTISEPFKVCPRTDYIANPLKFDGYSVWKQCDENAVETCSEVARLDAAPVIPTRFDYEFSFGSLRRRCSVWNSQATPNQKPDALNSIPRIVKLSRGLLAPNYPLIKPLERLLHNPIYFIGLMLIVWSHSVALPQPISIIHGPRLLFYMAAIIWRFSILYNGLGIIERIPLIQTMLMYYNKQVQISHTWVSTRFTDKVDFSDHIVLYHLFTFVMSTEAFCLARFREPSPCTTTPSGTLDRSSKVNSIDKPFVVPSKLLRIIELSICAFNLLMAYSCFVTAAFYHSPLESIIASIVSILGIYFVFWLLVIMDRAISSHHFGLIT